MNLPISVEFNREPESEVVAFEVVAIHEGVEYVFAGHTTDLKTTTRPASPANAFMARVLLAVEEVLLGAEEYANHREDNP